MVILSTCLIIYSSFALQRCVWTSNRMIRWTQPRHPDIAPVFNRARTLSRTGARKGKDTRDGYVLQSWFNWALSGWIYIPISLVGS